jgi:hypothetical protein
LSFTNDNPLLSNQVPVSLDVDPEEKGFHSILLLYLRRVANAVNTKDQAFYLLQETGNFQQWFTLGNPQQNRFAYRTTFDFVDLNGGNIPAGTTSLPALTTSTQPVAITGFLNPTRGIGGATDTMGNVYFPSDPNVTVTFNPSTQIFTIVNNTGNALTQFYWCMEYLKN